MLTDICRICGGSGTVTVNRSIDGGFDYHDITCQRCRGMGQVPENDPGLARAKSYEWDREQKLRWRAVVDEHLDWVGKGRPRRTDAERDKIISDKIKKWLDE